MTIQRRAIFPSLLAGATISCMAALLTHDFIVRYGTGQLAKSINVKSSPSVRYMGPVIQISPVIEFHVPAVLSEGDGARLTVSISKTLLGHGDLFPGSNPTVFSDEPVRWDTADVDHPFELDLAVGDGLALNPDVRSVKLSFKEPKSLSEPPLNSHWALAAKTAGTHVLLVKGLPLTESNVRFEYPDQATAPKEPFATILADGTLELRILALTSLGLTPKQDAIFKAIGGVAGFLGTLLAYPIFSRLFKKDDEGKKSVWTKHET